MIQKLINDIVEKYNALKNRIASLTEELEKLNKESESIIIEPRPKKSQFNLFKRIIFNEYNKKINQIIESNRQKTDQIEIINHRIIKIKLEIKSVQAQLEQMGLKDKNGDLGDIITIEYLLSKDPKLASNLEFMKEAIKLSPFNIVFDKTNDKDIYIEFIKYLKANVSKKFWEGNSEPYPSNRYNEYLKAFDDILEELSNPSRIEDGRFRIPIKYLFESVRIGINNINDGKGKNSVEKDLLLKKYIDYIYFKIGEYLSLNGVLSYEYGSSMSEIWDNPDMLAGVHGVCRNAGDLIEDDSTIDSIMRQGIRATNAMGEMSGASPNPAILQTAYVQDYTDLDFLSFLHYSYANTYGFIVFQIPKNGMGKTASVPIWGIDEDTIYGRDGKAFLKPEYILGYVVNNSRVKLADLKFVKNDIQPRKYKYSLMDCTCSYSGDTIYPDEEKKQK